jgi:hypothetical protein
MEMIMSLHEKHTVAAADRPVFRKWALGVAAFYGAVAFLVIGAIAVGQYVGGGPQHASVVAASTVAPR